jgi:anaerobic magnesium-protoporphyrin IX monomethyl ester cyclase
MSSHTTITRQPVEAAPSPEERNGDRIKSKVLLMRAHYQKEYRSPGFPVGISLIASYLDSKEVFVRVLDLAVHRDWKEALRKEMDQHAFAAVGISCQIIQYEQACEAIQFIKQHYPATKVVAGGAFPSTAPEDCLRNSDIDAVCCGEGELTMLELLQAWERGLPLDQVHGIAFRGENGKAIKTQPRALIEDLDEMPLAAYHLLDIAPYISAEHAADFTGKKRRCIELITSRGCPYQCIYCHSLFGKRFRGRSAQNVMDEIRLLHDKYEITEYVIWDDTFTMDLPRAKKICDLIVESGLKIVLQLRAGVRSESMDEELMAKLKQAGTETMCVGIETAVWRVQKLIKKNLKIEKVEALLDLAAKYKITTIGFMMLGFPGETVAEIRESIRWASQSKLDYTFFSIATPYPGTELYDLAIQNGYFAQNGDYNSMHVSIPHMEMPEVPSGKLKWLQIQAYLRFYLKPWRLAKLLSSVYILKTFAGSLGTYLTIAVSYYCRKLASPFRRAD